MDLPHKTRILAVDDSPDNLFLLESLLSEEDRYHLQFARDGKTALDLVRQSSPDIILLDVMMPSISGYDVVRQIRQAKELPYIPILLITAYAESSLVEGLDAGADDFLRKPFDVNELLARVRSMVRLKQSIDAYRHLIQQRDDFVTRLTHDLRTPLIAADRVLELCVQEVFGSVSNDAKNALVNVIENNADLLAMTNTLLEVHRYAAGQKRLVPSPIRLQSLCSDVVQELTPLAQEKNLLLTLDISAQDASAQDASAKQNSDAYLIKGDRIELRRLITNLVGNAIKFTDTGHIAVHLRARDPKAVALVVEDSGRGMSEDDQRQAFEWFQQGNHRRAGSGLGLHLAQRIAHLHGGHISIDSALGKGTVITLTLPQP
ncbi:MAG: sensor histidine kinase [Elainellaceae cyanobacterium]